MHRVLNEPPNLTGCSGPLRTLIERCLAKDAPDRPEPGRDHRVLPGPGRREPGRLHRLVASARDGRRRGPHSRDAGRCPVPVPVSCRGSGERHDAGPGRCAVRSGPFALPGTGRRANHATGRRANHAAGFHRRARHLPSAPRRCQWPYGPRGSRLPGRVTRVHRAWWPCRADLAGRRTPVPSSLTTAARLMYAGAGLSALGAIVGLATVHELQVIADQQWAARGAVGAAVAILLIHGVIGTALWFWLARETRTRPAPRPGLGHGHLLHRHRQRDQCRCPRAVDRPDPGVQRHRMGDRPVRRHPALEPALAVLLRRAAASGHRAATGQPYARRPVPESPAAPGPVRPAEHPAGLVGPLVARELARPGPLRSQRPPGPAPAVGAPSQGLSPGQVNWSQPSRRTARGSMVTGYRAAHGQEVCVRTAGPGTVRGLLSSYDRKGLWRSW